MDAQMLMQLLVLLVLMVWMLSGLFVAFLMRMTDESKGKIGKIKGYWIKGRGLYLFSVLMLVLAGPASLLIGIAVVYDYCSSSSKE